MLGAQVRLLLSVAASSLRISLCSTAVRCPYIAPACVLTLLCFPRAVPVLLVVLCRTQFRLWSQDEVSTADAQLPANPVADTFAQLMTGLYSRLQAAAGACYEPR
jgi:hypothetical protein